MSAPEPPQNVEGGTREKWKSIINRLSAIHRLASSGVVDINASDEALATQYSEGEWVQTPQGLGLVSEVRTEPFEGKDGEVEASTDSPTYVIGLKDTRIGVGFYKASELSESEGPETDVDDPVDDVEALFNIEAAIDGEYEALDWTMPDSWRESETPARVILLAAWQSMGGQFNCNGGCCMSELKSERLCGAMKDEVLGGWTGWR